MLECIDFAFLADRVIPALNRGLDVSLRLIIPAALIGGALGVFTGVTRVFGPRWARRLADAAVAVIRGVPLTVQLMILYFGLPNVPYLRIDLEPFTAALAGFIFCTGAYQSEYVRGALLSIRQGQIRAGQALGMTKLQIITCIELTGRAKTLISQTYRPTEVYLTAALYYLAMVTLATWLLNWLERKLAIPGFGKNNT